MVAPKQQVACSSTHSTANFRLRAVAGCATVSANSLLLASNASQRPCAETSNLENSIDKIINKRNASIALFIMLILLLTLQAPVCCGDVVTSELTLPSEAKQALRPAQVLLASVNNPATGHVMTNAHAAKTQVEARRSVLIKPAKVQQAAVELGNPETIISKPPKLADIPVLDLTAIAPASAPRQLTTTENENIKTDAAATLTAVAATGYVKIAHSGKALDDTVATWECVEDKSSKLTWEVKKDDGGIRDRDHSYSWLTEIEGRREGISNGGRCKGNVSCDTNSYAQTMNKQTLCGYSDWRLPTRAELETLVEYRNNPAEATINKQYFPEAIPSWYWTSTENINREGYAWYVLFRNGVALNDLKERPKHIRLVRGRVEE